MPRDPKKPGGASGTAPTAPAATPLEAKPLVPAGRDKDGQVPIAEIAPCPFNLRGEDLGTESERAEMMAQLKDDGLIQAIVVVTAEAFFARFPQDEYAEWAERIGECRYVAVAGHRRLQGALDLGWEKVKIDVQNKRALSIHLTMLKENLGRKDLAPLQEAAGYLFLTTVENMSHQAIATALGKAKSYVTKRLALLELPDDVKAQIVPGGLGVDAAYNLGVALDGHHELILAAWRVMTADRLSAKEAAARVLATDLAELGGADDEADFAGSADSATEAGPVLAEPGDPRNGGPVLPEPASGEDEADGRASEASADPAARTGQAKPKVPGARSSQPSRAANTAKRTEACRRLVAKTSAADPDLVPSLAYALIASARPAVLDRALTWLKEQDAGIVADDAAGFAAATVEAGDVEALSRLAHAVALVSSEQRASDSRRGGWDVFDQAYFNRLTSAGYEPIDELPARS